MRVKQVIYTKRRALAQHEEPKWINSSCCIGETGLLAEGFQYVGGHQNTVDNVDDAIGSHDIGRGD